MTKTHEMTCDASYPRPTETGTERGVDVDWTLTMPDGREIEGEATLLPREDGSDYGSWGEPAHWLSGDALRVLSALPDRDYTAALRAIEAACAEVAAMGEAIPSVTVATVYDYRTGDTLTTGLPVSAVSDEAVQTAQRIAARRSESVLLQDDNGEWIVSPSGACKRR